MWRTPADRAASARTRLELAAALWGWRPHPGQQALLLSAAPFRVAACGRRWGKTEALSLDIATLAVAEARAGRPCRQLVVAPTDAQARLIGAAVQARLEAATLEGGAGLAVRRHPALRLTLPPAPAPEVSVAFHTAGRDGRGLRGLWAHRIVVDEAGYVPDAVLTEVLLPMLTDVGGELLLASSPAGRRGAFYRLFARGMAPTSPCPQKPSPCPLPSLGEGFEEGLTYESFQCPSSDNPHLDRAYLAAMAAELGEQSYAAEYGAQFVDDGGAVFRADDIDGCLADDDRVALDGGDLVSAPQAGRWYSVGVDWGRRRDFTVVCVLDGTDRPARLVGLWRWQGMGWEAQALRVGALIASFLPRRVLADGNSIGDPLAEQLQRAIAGHVREGDWTPQVERFVFGAESKTRLVDALTLGLSARALTYPSHRALLGELRGFEYGAQTAGGRHRMAARGGGHDDIVMALALAWWCAPAGAPAAPASRLLLGSQAGLGRRG